MKDSLPSPRISAELFRSAFENAAPGMALVDPQGRFLEVNSAFCQMTGYSEAELLASTVSGISHPDDRELEAACQRKLAAGKSDHYQIHKRYQHKNGSTVWALLHLSVVRDENGEPQFFISHVQDVTNEKTHTADLDRAAEEIARLRQGLLKICAWTKRIEVDSRWITVDEFLRDHLHLKLTHGMSVEGARLFHNE